MKSRKKRGENPEGCYVNSDMETEHRLRRNNRFTQIGVGLLREVVSRQFHLCGEGLR